MGVIMGDMGDVFNAARKKGQERRANNREHSAQLLKKSGIEFESKNWGAHLIVRGNDCVVDFWPGTGKWIMRNGQRGFGVRNLMRKLREPER